MATGLMDARIDERRSPSDQEEAETITAARQSSGWQGLYMGGTCFKKQREVPPDLYGLSASIAVDHMDCRYNFWNCHGP